MTLVEAVKAKYLEKQEPFFCLEHEGITYLVRAEQKGVVLHIFEGCFPVTKTTLGGIDDSGNGHRS